MTRLIDPGLERKAEQRGLTRDSREHRRALVPCRARGRRGALARGSRAITEAREQRVPALGHVGSEARDGGASALASASRTATRAWG